MARRGDRWVGWVTVFALCCGAAIAQTAQISLGTEAVQPDGTVTVPVLLSSNGLAVAAIQVDLAYDSSTASVTGAVDPNASAASKTLSAGNIANLQERFILEGLNQSTLADGVVIDLVLTPSSGGGSGPYRLSLGNVLGVAPDGSMISASVAPGGTPPVLTPLSFSIVNGASLKTGAVAPGEIVTLFGTGLLPVGGDPSQTGITFNGVPAPLLYVAANQINTVIPFATSGKPSASVAITYLGGQIGSGTIAVATAAPAAFTVSASGKGQAAIINEDGSQNSASQPAARGSTISLYATGAGAMNPPLSDGEIVPVGTSSAPVAPIGIRFDGGISAKVTYAGPAPGLIAGVLQVNFVVPANVSTGSTVAFFMTAGGVASPAVTLAVN